ncbi:DUF6932 family protein [Burkholderia ubonensis]|uniref:DUF6932 family protein n=1 Tax=Burkholderia ubonensis TaxID=101571 RepID=UPI0009B3B032
MPPVVVPPWNQYQVLPPINARNPAGVDRSPYDVTVDALVSHFATSTERCDILDGYLTLRSELHAAGLRNGFQWVNGSFSEHVEVLEGRAPNDVDVVTFVRDEHNNAQNLAPNLLQQAWVKQHRRVDHYWVDLHRTVAEKLVTITAYWYSMWSHRRNTLWKGFLQVDLDDQHDAAAATRLAEARNRLAQQNQALGGNP